MQNKIKATYQNGVFVPILNGENLDLQENSTVELTLETVEENQTKQSVVNGSSESKRQKQAEWIKANREKYGGQYVALDGDKLLGTGKNYGEAFEAARSAGVEDAFVDFIPPKDYVGEMGGW